MIRHGNREYRRNILSRDVIRLNSPPSTVPAQLERY